MNIREEDTHPIHLGGCIALCIILTFTTQPDDPDAATHLVLGVGNHEEPLHGQRHCHEDGACQGNLGQGQDDREHVRGNLENIVLTLIKTGCFAP